MTREYIPFSEIIIELKQICDRRRTGTLFVATKANRSAQIMIDNGEIVYMYSYNKRGQDALELMATIEFGTYRFQEGSVTARRVPMPKTHAILQTLMGETSQGGAGSKVVQNDAGISSLNHKQKIVLEECLAEYIGPMAAIICEEHCVSAVDFAMAVDLLAAEIPSVDQSAQFKAKVIARIG